MDYETTTKFLEELKSPEGQAWEVLEKVCRPWLKHFAIKQKISEQLAEDVVQETFLRFAKSYWEGKYIRKKARLRSWLFGIAYKVILEMKKKQLREPSVTGHKGRTKILELIEDKNAVHHTWDMEWRKLVGEYCLERVRQSRPKDFKIFKCYTYSKKSAEEVAQELQIKRSAVYTASSRIHAKMREYREEIENIL